jgi:hypothetical protein
VASFAAKFMPQCSTAACICCIPFDTNCTKFPVWNSLASPHGTLLDAVTAVKRPPCKAVKSTRQNINSPENQSLCCDVRFKVPQRGHVESFPHVPSRSSGHPKYHRRWNLSPLLTDCPHSTAYSSLSVDSECSAVKKSA